MAELLPSCHVKKELFKIKSLILKENQACALPQGKSRIDLETREDRKSRKASVLVRFTFQLTFDHTLFNFRTFATTKHFYCMHSKQHTPPN